MSADNGLDIHQAAAELLDNSGHRYTSARRAMVEALNRAGAPLSIPQLLNADNRLVQSSTYRNLVVLEQAGVATRVVTADDHALFELDERITDHHHHHLICSGCGDVQDFELRHDVEELLQGEFDRAGRAATFRVERHRIDLLGLCGRCA